jgi:cytochrome c-type biogenesis protein CcmH/NrfF
MARIDGMTDGGKKTSRCHPESPLGVRDPHFDFAFVMKRSLCKRVLFAAFALVYALTPAAFAQQSTRVTEIGKRVNCMCAGCGDSAALCNHPGASFAGPCDVAKNELKEISERVGRGDSDDLILQSFIQEYGTQVVIVPEAKGFNRWIWLMPIVFVIAGFFLVRAVLQSWRRRAAQAHPAGVSPDLLARARHEIGPDE